MDIEIKSEELNVGFFKIGNTVTVAETADVDDYFWNQVGTIVEFGIEECTNRDPDRCIWVHLPRTKLYMLHSHHDSSAPKEKKRWICFKKDELQLGCAQTLQKIVDDLIEDAKTYHSHRIMHECTDGTCIVKGCNSIATGYAIYNVWGAGTVFRACDEHRKQYNCTWCESQPFENKTEGLISPNLQEKRESSII